MILKEGIRKRNLNESPVFNTTPSDVGRGFIIDNPSELWKLRTYGRTAVVIVPTFKKTDEFKYSSASTQGGAMTGYRDIYFTSEQDANQWLEQHEDDYPDYYVIKASRQNNVSEILKIKLYDNSWVWINTLCLPGVPNLRTHPKLSGGGGTQPRDYDFEQSANWWDTASTKWPNIFGSYLRRQNITSTNNYMQIEEILQEVSRTLNTTVRLQDNNDGTFYFVDERGNHLTNLLHWHTFMGPGASGFLHYNWDSLDEHKLFDFIINMLTSDRYPYTLFRPEFNWHPQNQLPDEQNENDDDDLDESLSRINLNESPVFDTGSVSPEKLTDKELKRLAIKYIQENGFEKAYVDYKPTRNNGIGYYPEYHGSETARRVKDKLLDFQYLLDHRVSEWDNVLTNTHHREDRTERINEIWTEDFCNLNTLREVNDFVRSVDPNTSINPDWLRRCQATWNKTGDLDQFTEKDIENICSVINYWIKQKEYQQRQREKEERRITHDNYVSSNVNSFAGDIGEVVSFVVATVKEIYGEYGIIYQCVGTDGRHYTVASTKIDSVDVGDTITGKIKSLSEFRGVKETRLRFISQTKAN